MKRILLAAAIAFLAISSWGATTTPIQLLSPAGSTSGQVITSSGPTTAPAWTTVTLSGLGGLAAANNLSDLVSASTARTNLGLGTSSTVNVGTSGATIPLLSTANTWTLAQAFTVRPTFNGATPYDTGNLTIANYALLASPTFTGTVTTAALTATGAITPSQTIGIVGTNTSNDANVGSFGEYQAATTAATSLTTGVAANCTSVSLSAGDWDVRGVIKFTPAGSTIPTGAIASINTTSATLGTDDTMQGLSVTFATGTPIRIATPVVRIRIGSTTTVFLVGFGIFSTSTETCDGYIRARRVR